jgi:hypothetical protein
MNLINKSPSGKSLINFDFTSAISPFFSSTTNALNSFGS